jgi:hypothetical protein
METRREAMPANKEEVISFKADSGLAGSLKNLPNRSQFIRQAVLQALNRVCPLCRGSGTLSPDQQNHWNEFAKRHTLTECSDCGSLHLVCSAEGEARGVSSRRDPG